MIFIKRIRRFSLILPAALALIAAGIGIFLFGSPMGPEALPHGAGSIEIFDIGKGEVVKRVESGRPARREAEKLIGRVSGLYQKFKPFPEKGIIVRIPLEPALKVKNEHVTGSGIDFADTLYLVFPEEGGQYLMVLDDRQRPWFYIFKGDAGIFAKYKR